MTVHIPKWVFAGALVALVAIAAFLVGRSTDDGSSPPAAPPGESTAGATVKEATCSKSMAERATVASSFDDAILDRTAVQGKMEGTGFTGSRFFTDSPVDYQVAILRCRDLTGDGIDEMVVGLGAGAASRIFQWAIFTPDADGRWQLAFDREGSTVSSIATHRDAVVVRTPTYGSNDPLCCPSGFKSTAVAFHDDAFAVVSRASAEERLIDISGGAVTRVGNFHPRRDSVTQALADFGTPTSIDNYPASACRLDWSDLGMTITFANFGGGDPCGTAGRVGSFELIGSPAAQASWHLTGGARVGLSTQATRNLYPGARQSGSQLILAEAPFPYGEGAATPVATAYLLGGKVMAFRFYVGAAGE